VLLHGRAASRHVYHHVVNTAGLERINQVAGELLCLLLTTCVQRKRAATSLGRRGHDVAPLGRKNTNGGSVHVREEHALNTTSEQAHNAAADPLGGCVLRVPRPAPGGGWR